MKYLSGIVCLLMCACNLSEPKEFDWQGHRGARGNYPENTSPAFFYALDQGMHTLEMDVVISADSQVVVSHEPFFNPEICDTGLLQSDSLENNIYSLSYSIISQIDCGLKGNPHFEGQQKMAIAKPLLIDVIQASDEYARQLGRTLPAYNIEIKSRPQWDGKFHPNVEAYADLVMSIITETGIDFRVSIQSFDERPLQYLHHRYPNLSLTLLVEDEMPASDHIRVLGFKPDVYSCQYHLVDETLVQFCHDNDMKIIPWTVNDEAEIRRLGKLGVDGVITDYPALKEKITGQPGG